MNVSNFANATLSLNRGTIGQSPTGGNTRTPKALITNVEASVQPASGQTIYDYMRRGLKIDTSIYIDAVDFRNNAAVPGGLMENDVFIDQDGIKYVVVGYQRLYQPNIDPDPQFTIHCKQQL